MLPIEPHLPRILESLKNTPNLVLQASPGSGKTTRVPPALMDADFCGSRSILVLEPRRLAAKMAAQRVAFERRESVGQSVGYQFRHERAISSQTRLLFLTEGMLMRKLIQDTDLKHAGIVVLDEFHERHLHGDIALAHLRRLQLTRRPDLRIIVMSATLETQTLSRFLGDAPVISIQGKQFEVEIEYAEETVRDAVTRELARKRPSGHILVFLPGMADIRRTEEALRPLAAQKNLALMPLHGELAREDQERALAPSSETKVILATNVAETSLTIDGVTTVVDSGLHRVASHSWWSGVPALRTRPISRASAIQRAGRAGRTSPGRCIRLYSRGDFDTRPAFDSPEIQRADLTQSILELQALEKEDFSRFTWFESPPATSLGAAQTLLYRLGATTSADSTSRLTSVGARMIRIPTHPRLARILIEAVKSGPQATSEALHWVARISEGELEGSNAFDAIECLSSASSSEAIRKTKQQLQNALASLESDELKAQNRPEKSLSKPLKSILRFALLTGFPDRLAKKKPTNSDALAIRTELLLSSGGAMTLENVGPVASVLEKSDLFIVLSAQEKKHLNQARAQLHIQSLCPIETDWLLDLEPPALTESFEYHWDPKLERVFEISRLSCDAIILTESRANPKASREALRWVFKSGLGIDLDTFPRLTLQEIATTLNALTESGGFESYLARAELFLRETDSPLTPLQLTNALYEIGTRDTCITSVREARNKDWPVELLASLLGEQYSKLEALLPQTLVLPSGRKTQVHYRLGQTPWVESRLQDFFGLKQGPSVMRGRIPLTLHLLAPNYRAVQVTTDLLGFWQRAYPEIRRELCRRYPRHKWPIDPLQPS